MLLQLPLDILKYQIFPLLNNTTLAILRYTSTRFHQLIGPQKINLVELLRSNNLNLVVWGQPPNYQYNGATVYFLIQDKYDINLNILLWLLQHTKFDGFIGNAQCSPYLELGTGGDDISLCDIIDLITQSNLSIIKFLWRKERQWCDPHRLFIQATVRHKYSTMKFLLRNGNLNKDKLFDDILTQCKDTASSIEVLRWCINKGIKTTPLSANFARFRDLYDIYRWLTLGNRNYIQDSTTSSCSESED